MDNPVFKYVAVLRSVLIHECQGFFQKKKLKIQKGPLYGFADIEISLKIALLNEQSKVGKSLQSEAY